MTVELATKSDIQSLKMEIVDELRKLLQPSVPQKQWMKSSDVMKLIQCSPGTLQNLRINGTLPFTKMGGTIYYAYDDVIKVFNNNKQNAA